MSDKQPTKEQVKDLTYWKNNAEEDYITTPISVLRYISELEKQIPIELPSDEEIKKLNPYSYGSHYAGGKDVVWELAAEDVMRHIQSKIQGGK